MMERRRTRAIRNRIIAGVVVLAVLAGIVFLVFALEFADTFFVKIHNDLGKKGTSL